MVGLTIPCLALALVARCVSTLLRSSYTNVLPKEFDDDPIANFTVQTPGDDENVLSLERFKSILKSVSCSSTSITLAFDDDSSFAYAKRVWDWVNGADNHAFILVVGRGDCGKNEHRLPYLVRTLHYDEKANVATLSGEQGDWKSLVHSFELRVGDMEAPSSTSLRKRLSWNKNIPIDMNRSFNPSISETFGSLTLGIGCNDCGTRGTLNLALHIAVGLSNHASFKFTPSGLGAHAGVKLSASGALSGKWSPPLSPAIDIPLDPWGIPDVFNIGPALKFQLGADVGGIKGTLSATAGAGVSISDGAVASFDILHPSDRQFSGWSPSFTVDPVQVTTEIQGDIKVYLQSSVVLEAEALGLGYDVGLKFKYPELDTKFELEACKFSHCSCFGCGAQY
jgi:hypothetical protein